MKNNYLKQKLLAVVMILSVFLANHNVFAQSVTIPAANTNTGSQRWPLGAWYGYERVTAIYTAAEITTAGAIDSVGWYVNSIATPAASTPVMVYMKMVTYSTLAAATTTIADTTGATLVYNGNVLSSQLAANTWTMLKIPTPFAYTGGANNLQITVLTNGGGGGIDPQFGKQYRYHTAASSSVETWAQDNTPPTGTGTTGTNRPNLALHVVSAPMTYASSDVVTATPAIVAKNTPNAAVVRLNVVTAGYLTPISLTSLDVSTNGTSSLADISNLKIYYTGSSTTFSTATPFGSTVASPAFTQTVNGTQALANGNNYFWVTYDVASGATAGNTIDAEIGSITVGGSPNVPTTTAPAGNRTIRNALAGPYTVGSGGTYATLNDAMTELVVLGMSANVNLNLISDITEPAPVVVPQWTETGLGNYTLTIAPTIPVIISANAANTGVIVLNGADRVVIDGRIAGSGNNLTLVNTNTGTTQVGVLLASLGTGLGCVNNTIRNTNIQLSNVTTNTCLGIQAQGDNNHNLSIMNNLINKVGIAINIFSSTAPAGNHNGLVISGNTIGSELVSEYVTFGGINVANAPAALISQNTISNIISGNAARQYGIQLGAYTGSTTITRNRIHRILNSSSSGFGAYGINLSSGTSADTVTISNNAITRMAIYNFSTSNTTDNPFGIRLAGGVRHRVIYNSVNLFGPASGAGTAGTLSAALMITSGTNHLVRNNVLANKYSGLAGSLSYPIYAVTGTTFTVINNNNYDTTGAGSYGRIGFLGSAYTNLPAWRVATTQDSISYAMLSSFANDSDLTITSAGTPSALESGATPIAGVTTDFNGDTRPKTVPTTYGGNTAPDIGAYEFDGTKADFVAPQVVYTAFGLTTTSTANRPLTAVAITDASGINVTPGSKPRIYYKRPTEANAFPGNTSADNGWKYTEATNASSPFNFTIDYSILLGGSINLRDTVQYFIVGQDNAPTPNIGSSPAVGVAGTGVATMTSGPTTPNYYIVIGGPMSGSFLVGSAQAQPNYTTVSGAIKDVMLRGVSGAVIFNLTDATYNIASGEQFPIAVGAYTGASPVNTITIRPDAGVTSVVSGSVANSLIRFDGAKYVTIDGRQGGSGTPKSLTFQNDNVGGSTVTFINDATSNTLKYAVFKASNTTATTGVINFSTGVTTGNDSMTIDNCDIGDGATTPATLIQSAGSTDGTVAKFNDYNTVSNCNLFNYFNSSAEANAFKISNGNNYWTITGNSVYQTATRTSSSDQYTFNFQNSSNLNALNGCQITNNYIGGSAPLCGGTPWTMNSGAARFTSFFNLGNLAMNNVSGNTFANITCTSTSTTTTGTGAWNAIQYVNGMLNIDNNIIGSLTGLNSIVLKSGSAGVCFGISATPSVVPGTFSISGNKFGGIKVDGSGSTSNNLALINITSAANNITFNVNNNTIGNGLPDNMVIAASSSTTAQSLRGINNTSTANLNITNNTIHNLTNLYASTGAGLTFGIASSGGVNVITGNTIDSLTSATTQVGTTTGSAVMGINFTSTTGTSFIGQNTIYGLKSTAATAAVSVVGINYSGTTNDIGIARNIIHSFSTASTSITSQQNGINFIAGTTRVYNNMIRLGIDVAGASQVVTPVITGINKSGGNIRAFFNTVYIGGTGVGTGLAKTYAYSRTASGIDSVYNNVFANERSNATTGGTHFAINMTNTTTLSQNSNVFWVNGTGDTLGLFNGATKLNLGLFGAATLTDASSGFGNPQFIASGGAASTVDLHINAAVPSPVEGAGVSITGITDDIDGTTRSAVTPIDIGADAGNFIANDVFAPAIQFSPLPNTPITGDRTFTAIITDRTGLPVTAGGMRPVLYYKKFVSGGINSAQGTFTSGTPQNGTWSFTVSSSLLGGMSLGDSVYYYIVAQDSSAGSNLGSSPGGAIGDVNNVTTPPTYYTYKIVPGFTGAYTVGSSGTYPTLTGVGGAFEAINNSAITGNVSLTIVSDILEDGTNGLNQWSEGGTGNYTVSIVPDGTTERVIAGSVVAGLIRLNGADRVTIDGRFAGSGRYLRFRNRNLGAGTTFLFTNDAHRDTVTYCYIESLNNASGTILFATATTGSGNDSNGVNNCVIRDTLGTSATGNVPNTGISSAGSTGFENSENTIANNEFFNFGFNGVNLNTTGTGDNWKINNNTFYETATRANSYKVILVQGGNNQQINNNSIGGAANDRSGLPMQTTSTTGTCYTGILISTTGGTGYTVSNNTIGNVFANSAGNDHSFVGIDINGPSGTINGNTIGGSANPYDTIRCDGDSKGMRNIGAGTVIMSNNTVSNITNQSLGNDYLAAIEGSAGNNTITGNTVKNITQFYTSITTVNLACTGINITSAGTNVVTDNTVSAVKYLGSTSGVPATGIGHASGLNTLIARNRVYNIASTTAAAGTVAIGIVTSGGVVTIVNNQVSIGDGSAGDVKVYGIRDEGTGTTNIYYNSVFVNGSNNSANNTYGILRTTTSITDVKNNIIYNKRSASSTGLNFAVGSTSATGITPNIIGYNLMVVPNASALAELPGGVSNDIPTFNTLYSGNNTYNTNWMTTAASLPAQLLFTDTAVGNLGIVTANAESWYANGKGLSLASTSGDFTNPSGVRSIAISSGSTAFGSVEFNTVTTPPSATASGAPAVSTTTTYTFAGRQVASVTWGASGTVPTALDVKYYTGQTAPNLLPSKTQFNAYHAVTPTGGTGYTYTITVNYDSATFGNVSSTGSTRLARYKSPSWNLYATSAASGATGMLASNNALAAATLPANFTGTDIANALPVEFLAFTASAKKSDVVLNWSTASEVNNSGFDIERSADGKSFKAVRFVEGAGNSNTVSNYNEVDEEAFNAENSNVLYYRLKQTDMDGKFNYSAVVKVNKADGKHASLVAYPNPFTDKVTVTLESANAGTAQVMIADINGRLISSYQVDVQKGNTSFDLQHVSNLEAGIYFAKVIANGEAQVIKLVKTN